MKVMNLCTRRLYTFEIGFKPQVNNSFSIIKMNGDIHRYLHIRIFNLNTWNLTKAPSFVLMATFTFNLWLLKLSNSLIRISFLLLQV